MLPSISSSQGYQGYQPPQHDSAMPDEPTTLKRSRDSDDNTELPNKKPRRENDYTLFFLDRDILKYKILKEFEYQENLFVRPRVIGQALGAFACVSKMANAVIGEMRADSSNCKLAMNTDDISNKERAVVLALKNNEESLISDIGNLLTRCNSIQHFVLSVPPNRMSITFTVFENLQTLSLKGMKGLTELALPGNGLNHLKWISLTDCPKLSKLPSGMIHLLHLNISHAESLSSLPGDLYNLKTLNCSSSLITALPEGLINLKWLDCSNTYITNVPENFSGLEKLICRGCTNLLTLPSVMPNIILLDCTYATYIKRLPTGMNKLKKLICEGCEKLVILPRDMNSLKLLDVSDCRALTGGIVPNDTPENLEIKHNHIQIIREEEGIDIDVD